MITDNDIQRAIRISQALQDHFDKNPGSEALRSTDAYDILVRKGLAERDRHHGVKFREFLNHLKKNNALNLIPQCRWEESSGHYTNWFFQTNKAKTIKAMNLKPVALAGQKPELNWEEWSEKIMELPKRDPSDFILPQLEVRKNFPRAYELWTKPEEDLLLEVIQKIKDPFELGKLFQRQPSAIQNRLKTKHNIIL